MRFYPKLILAGLVLAAVVAIFLSRAPQPISLPQQGPEGPVWLFDFGPELAEPFAGFARVSGRTHYEANPGYGWLDVEGELESGTFHNPSLHWEGARNLNLVQRAGPDSLAASFATGPAVFALDLEPGRYDVWLLTGDWGLLEYTPHETYRIVLEERTVRIPGPNADEFYQRFETPGPDDTISDEEVYARYVAPRFRWERLEVSVDDAQLRVQVLAPERSRSLLDKLGYYAHADIKQGPPHRFAGALNAMIVTPSDSRSSQRIERIDGMREERFLERHRLIASEEVAPGPGDADLERGYSLFPASTIDSITPDTIQDHELRALKLRATPGEYAPVTFAMRPHRDLGSMTVVPTDLRSRDGARIQRTSIAIGAVRYRAGRTSRRASTWEPKPHLIVPGTLHQLKSHVTKQLWITLHVPDDGAPGNYAGALEIVLESGAATTIPIELEVLPFRLQRPTHIATGLTYFVPIAYAYYDEERFWRRIRAEFEDMRRHNMTTVQLTGMGIENFDALDRLFRIYRDAGFEQPIYLLEAYSAIDLVTQMYGHPQETDEFYARYVQIFAELLEEARRRNWPPLIVNFGDEFTNSAREEFGAELARRLRLLPGIVTGADANGYREVELLAPHVSILAFNQGWSGPNGINGEKKLLNAETVALVQNAGAKPWLVNVRQDRFSNGAYLWKMMRLGVRGKLEWIFSNYGAEPHNPFDGVGLRTSQLAVAGPSNTTLPTLAYERMRQGLDDLAYLYTLEALVRSAPRSAEREHAQALLERVDSMIDDDFETYRGTGGENWSAERYEDLRNDVIDAILSLQSLAETVDPGWHQRVRARP